MASDKNYQIPYGVCEINKAGRLKSVKEKPTFNFLINIGIYIFNKKILKIIPNNKYFDANQLINLAKKKRFKIGVFPVSDSDWKDTGSWSELNKININ